MTSSGAAIGEGDVLDLLATGDLQILGLLPYASNATLLVKVEGADLDTLAVYKPRRGEAPLWDFPRGTLCLREYAAWVVDRSLGWDLVPPTVLRDGPAGLGAVQLFVEEDEATDVRDLLETHPDDLRRMALFDLVINNADRKGGHCLVDVTGKLWGVDHGIAFHAEPKLRTVIWSFEGEPIPAELLADLERLGTDHEALGILERFLVAEELEALHRRVAGLLRAPRFPAPGPGRAVPWPPW